MFDIWKLQPFFLVTSLSRIVISPLKLKAYPRSLDISTSERKRSWRWELSTYLGGINCPSKKTWTTQICHCFLPPESFDFFFQHRETSEVPGHVGHAAQEHGLKEPKRAIFEAKNAISNNIKQPEVWNLFIVCVLLSNFMNRKSMFHKSLYVTSSTATSLQGVLSSKVRLFVAICWSFKGAANHGLRKTVSVISFWTVDIASTPFWDKLMSYFLLAGKHMIVHVGFILMKEYSESLLTWECTFCKTNTSQNDSECHNVLVNQNKGSQDCSKPNNAHKSTVCWGNCQTYAKITCILYSIQNWNIEVPLMYNQCFSFVSYFVNCIIMISPLIIINHPLAQWPSVALWVVCWAPGDVENCSVFVPKK